MKQWWLLLHQYSFLPIPKRWQGQAADLPRALWLLPLWGLFAGLLCWGVACLIWVLGSRWAAVLMLGIGVLLNGGVWLRDVMLLAEGRHPLTVTQGERSTPPDNAPATPILFGRAALVVGGLYLLLQYLCLLALMYLRPQPYIYVAAAVCCRWVYVWGAYDFAALRPAFLHSGMQRRDFGRACCCAVAAVAVCVACDTALWLPLLLALLSAWLLFHTRARVLGALDEPVYGAAAAWAEVLLCVSYVLFI